MGPEQEMTNGEIGRSLTRIEATVTTLASQMQTALAPIAAHTVQIDNLQRRMGETEDDLKAVTKDANRIAGAGALLALLAGLLPLPWRK